MKPDNSAHHPSRILLREKTFRHNDEQNTFSPIVTRSAANVICGWRRTTARLNGVSGMNEIESISRLVRYSQPCLRSCWLRSEIRAHHGRGRQ